MGHLILFKKKYLFSIVEWYVNKKVASFLISVSWFPNKKQQVEVSQGVILTTGIYLCSVLNLPYLECLSLKKKKTIAFSVKFNIHETFSLKMTAPWQFSPTDLMPQKYHVFNTLTLMYQIRFELVSEWLSPGRLTTCQPK